VRILDDTFGSDANKNLSSESPKSKSSFARRRGHSRIVGTRRAGGNFPVTQKRRCPLCRNGGVAASFMCNCAMRMFILRVRQQTHTHTQLRNRFCYFNRAPHIFLLPLTRRPFVVGDVTQNYMRCHRTYLTCGVIIVCSVSYCVSWVAK
jgi:hypothetical protein